jgi:hypothetical protein
MGVVKHLIAIAAVASLLVGAAPASAASLVVKAGHGDPAATAGKRCPANVQIERVAVNGRAIAFAEDGPAARMYGRGAVIELRHRRGGRLRVRVAAVRRVRVVVTYRCLRR